MTLDIAHFDVRWGLFCPGILDDPYQPSADIGGQLLIPMVAPKEGLWPHGKDNIIPQHFFSLSCLYNHSQSP